jgi:hypothetical protein
MLVALAFVTAAVAQDADQSQANPPASEESEPAPAPETETEAGADDEFIPTEEIQADEEVTFPVDI